MKIMIAGGGTGGHIYPGIAIAKKIKEIKPDCDILFIGTNSGLEKKIVPKEGFDIKFITVEGLNKKFSIKTIGSAFKAVKGYVQSSKIIKSFKPDIVVGTGGYVCGPLVLSAHMHKIPTVIHEQNAFPGITNKILSRFVDKIAITYKESNKYFPQSKVIYTGNPVRSEILNVDKKSARNSFGFTEKGNVILIVGGSRGAKNINNAIVNIADDLKKFNMQVLFITGENEYDRIIGEFKSRGINTNGSNFKVYPYIYNMQEALGACDMIITRAGATILSEITVLGIPAIIVPSPYVANNHQEYNAKVLEKNGAGLIVHENELSTSKLIESIKEIMFDKEKYNLMCKKSRELSRVNAADNICDIILDLYKKVMHPSSK